MHKDPIIEGSYTRVKQTRHGLMLYNINDRYVGRSLDKYGEFSEAEAELFRQIIRPGATVVDAGANIGAHTLHFAQLVGPKGLVLAFEPQRLIFQMLCANMALNEIHNVHCLLMALGESAGQANIPTPDPQSEHNFGGVSLTAEPIGEVVDLLPLDNINFTRLDLLKVDVEGFEAAVVRGGMQTIQQHRPVLYLENDRREKSAELISLLQSLEYDLYWHLPPLYNPDNFYHETLNIFKDILSGNVLGIHKSIETNIQGMRRIENPSDWPLKGTS